MIPLQEQKLVLETRLKHTLFHSLLNTNFVLLSSNLDFKNFSNLVQLVLLSKFLVQICKVHDFHLQVMFLTVLFTNQSGNTTTIITTTKHKKRVLEALAQRPSLKRPKFNLHFQSL